MPNQLLSLGTRMDQDGGAWFEESPVSADRASCPAVQGNTNHCQVVRCQPGQVLSKETFEDVDKAEEERRPDRGRKSKRHPGDGAHTDRSLLHEASWMVACVDEDTLARPHCQAVEKRLGWTELWRNRHIMPKPHVGTLQHFGLPCPSVVRCGLLLCRLAMDQTMTLQSDSLRLWVRDLEKREKSLPRLAHSILQH